MGGDRLSTTCVRQDLQDFQDAHVNPENLVNPVQLPFQYHLRDGVLACV